MLEVVTEKHSGNWRLWVSVLIAAALVGALVYVGAQFDTGPQVKHPAPAAQTK